MAIKNKQNLDFYVFNNLRMFELESSVNSCNTECNQPQAQGIGNSPKSARQTQSSSSYCQKQEKVELDQDVADAGPGMYLLK